MRLLDTRRSYYLLAAAATIGLTLLYAISPMQGDDFWYLMTSSSASSPLEAMSDVWRECQRHWTFDTGRLANLINPPFLTLLPKWVYAILCGFAIIMVIHYSRWLADASSRSMRAFMIVVGVVFALPWSDYMFSIVFSLNYLWTSAFVLFALRQIIRSDEGHHLSAAALVGSLIMCFIAGWMHEGFSVPLLCGIVAYFLALGRMPSMQSVFLILAFALGALLIAVSPGLWGRTGSAAAGFGRHTFLEALLSGAVFNCLYYAFIVFSVITLLRKKKRERIGRHPSDMARLVMLMTATTVATILFFAFYGGSRMGWFGQLFSGIGILFCCRFFRSNLGHRMKAFYIVLIFAAVCGHLAYAIDWQIKLTKEFEEIRSLYSRSSDGILFYDVTPSRIDAALLKPSFRQFNEKFPLQQFSYYYGPGKPDLVLVPTALRQVRLEEASQTVDPRIVIYKEMILATDTLVTDNPRIEVRLGSGTWLPTRTRSVKFTDGSGHPYTLIIPHIRFADPTLKIGNARLQQLDSKR